MELYFNPILMLVLFSISISLYFGKNIFGGSEATVSFFKKKIWVLVISFIFILNGLVELFKVIM